MKWSENRWPHRNYVDYMQDDVINLLKSMHIVTDINWVGNYERTNAVFKDQSCEVSGEGLGERSKLRSQGKEPQTIFNFYRFR